MDNIRIIRVQGDRFVLRIGTWQTTLKRDELNGLYTRMMRALNEEEPDEPDRQAAHVSV